MDKVIEEMSNLIKEKDAQIKAIEDLVKLQATEMEESFKEVQATIPE